MSAKPILVLDVDGVVLPIQRDNTWYQDIQQDLGIDLDRMREEFFIPHYQKCMRGELDYKTELGRFLKESSANCDAEAFLAYTFSKEGSIDTEVVEAAVKWKKKTGGQLALATNQISPRADFIWHDLEMEKYCDVIVASCHVGAPKPEAQFYEAADQMLSRNPDQTVTFLDDTLSHVEGAKSHGWTAHHVDTSEVIVDLIEALGIE